MLLKNLISTTSNLGDINITGITCDSREVKDGYAFVCINGWKMDGHDFANKANESGAAVIIAERDLGLSNQLVVEDTHIAFATMSANWFDNPAKKIKFIGVTGTNGKTSVTYMIKAALEQCGEK
ncbi:MAG: UDP-N-acetylmuramoyl-L-alanyl-D-glutamate--2,6-diaminopimelate ligase, partial [Clostridia bacterium]|nr:UDP-N-acetylmuramoyl-L-alanyl-D-glutamate--2,6-diaminopimelate ligase [Clostridia bacterium]